jgi:nicotinamide-nucleotide amidase
MTLTLSERVGAALRTRGWTVCAAESCTGGLILTWLTDVPGSSAYVLGGVVAYAYSAKTALLGVDEQTLQRHGAVSETVARAMAQGARHAFGADVAISVTGIAGPGGGMPEKPVGLTWLGLAGPGEAMRVERHVWPGDRAQVRAASAMRALEMILELTQEGQS